MASLKRQVEALQKELESARAEFTAKMRDTHAVHAKDRAELEAELERTDTEVQETKEENERLRRMSDELFGRIETLEAQLHAATERLRVECTRPEEARARDAAVRKSFSLPSDDTVELSAGASTEHGQRGVLYVTTGHVAFETLPLLKLLVDVRIKFPIKEIATLDRIPGFFGRGSALAITLRDNTVHRFYGLFNRREVVQTIMHCAEKFRPIEIRLLRDGRSTLEATRHAATAAGLGLEKISPECPPPSTFTAYVCCPFLALFLQCSTSGRIFGDATKAPCGLWDVVVLSSGSRITLKSCYNGRYLCAERPLPLLPARMSASREKAGKWETWEIVYGAAPGQFALKSVHGQWLTAAPDGSFSVVPATKAPSHTETLTFSTG